ncbi:replication initiation protein [Cupriavidus sp. 30B13]|uniref:replication initiation protein n=1 Tax=Cupriavidus sp. 30B13 TaxID=3384241 RepID=UPI003B8FDD2C
MSDLVEFAERLSESERTPIAHLVASWACQEADAIEFLREIQSTSPKTDIHTTAEQARKRLLAIVEGLDSRHFDIVEQHGGLDDAGEALQWFRKARAAALRLYSVDANVICKFCETLHEAHAATGDLDRLRELCLREEQS